MIPQSTQYQATVMPNSRGYRHYGIVVISNDDYVLHETGEIASKQEFIDNFKNQPRPLCIVKQNISAFIATLDQKFDDDIQWQWRSKEVTAPIWTPTLGEGRKPEFVQTVFHYFGFKHNYNSIFHLPLDPTVFYVGKRIDELIPGDQSRECKLLEWAIKLRGFANESGIALRPTSGGMGSQFLKSAQFYPKARRKVPRCINERARENLPGNHYRLFATPNPEREYQAFYLDQRRAHHYHAHTTPLPSADYLFAYGSFRSLARSVYSAPFDDFTGLYFCDIYTRKIPANDPFVWFNSKEHTFSAFVWTNEVTYLAQQGYEITGIRAAWGSNRQDEGIRNYALFAETQLDRYQDAAWLKPVLLSTYGVLAVTPQDMSFVYKRSSRGEPVTLCAGHANLYGLLVSATNGRKIEPGIANVLQRGLIEAATRVESLDFALCWDYFGWRVLQIYADAIIIEDEGAPNGEWLLPYKHWRLRNTLHHYKPLHSQAFTSAEMDRLPGLTGKERIKHSHGGNRNVPLRPYYDAGTGGRVPLRDYAARGLRERRI